jgi:hypothetical protein
VSQSGRMFLGPECLSEKILRNSMLILYELTIWYNNWAYVRSHEIELRVHTTM